MNRTYLEICIHTFKYQKRLCWMLSSILQQQGNIPNILINISHTENDGNPTTKDVCDFFRAKGLNIDEMIVPHDEISNRSIARTKQLEKTTADWILFADSDMAYDPLFFDDLHTQMTTDLKNETKCVGADRVSLNIDHCVKFFNEDKNQYPLIIENVTEIVSKWPIYYIHGRTKAPGYFQLANVRAVRDKKINYGQARRDGLRRYRADRYFRVNMGGIMPIATKPQYHLNHDRSGEDIQR